MEGIYQQAAQGNVQIAAQLLQSMGKENKDLNEIVEELLENLEQGQELPPEAGGLPTEGLPPEAASLPSLGALGIGG